MFSKKYSLGAFILEAVLVGRCRFCSFVSTPSQATFPTIDRARRCRSAPVNIRLRNRPIIGSQKPLFFSLGFDACLGHLVLRVEPPRRQG